MLARSKGVATSWLIRRRRRCSWFPVHHRSSMVSRPSLHCSSMLSRPPPFVDGTPSLQVTPRKRRGHQISFHHRAKQRCGSNDQLGSVPLPTWRGNCTPGRKTRKVGEVSAKAGSNITCRMKLGFIMWQSRQEKSRSGSRKELICIRLTIKRGLDHSRLTVIWDWIFCWLECVIYVAIW